MRKLKSTWVNEGGDLIYQVIPKCGCTTLGQVLYHIDHGAYYDGDIHDAREGVWKSVNHADQELSNRKILAAIDGGQALTFTCVRNPYARLVSCFLDKFCRPQRSGGFYRGEMVPKIAEQYGMDLSEGFDQIKAFRKFLLFVRDTIKFGKPMAPDIHWQPVTRHCRYLLQVGGRFDMVFPMEALAEGLSSVLQRAELSDRIDLEALPRFNDSAGRLPAQAHPVADYYDDLTAHIMRSVFWWDFKLFNYHHEPNADGPTQPIDPEGINRWYKNQN